MTEAEVKEARVRQVSCHQCMELALGEVARLLEVAGNDDGAAIVRNWAANSRALNAAVVEAIK